MTKSNPDYNRLAVPNAGSSLNLFPRQPSILHIQYNRFIFFTYNPI